MPETQLVSEIDVLMKSSMWYEAGNMDSRGIMHLDRCQNILDRSIQRPAWMAPYPVSTFAECTEYASIHKINFSPSDRTLNSNLGFQCTVINIQVPVRLIVVSGKKQVLGD
ncbi:hypothetical protein NPIL_583961 [Nephila pilipes]|uniref:Uncharacterized protein n=1 Tax=Nephila pilipes TaxID=299642 RepID=A0A8X6PNP6_NEPPI|nr:hypothetical protein NPIL_583961 [Nephila pilipes]